MKKQSKSDKNEIAKRLNQWKELKVYLRFHVTIQDLSREIGINRTYLSNFINETYGENFNNWINGLRINEAKYKILTTSEDSLSEIARKVGFADLAHFSKIFKRKEGISPSDWKKQNIKDDETDFQ
ncbi:MAG: AraC family transcriptional regulator [Bacteroides sp.]|nr:AraC family transcriptional regulator [Bacteroides sp.]